MESLKALQGYTLEEGAYIIVPDRRVMGSVILENSIDLITPPIDKRKRKVVMKSLYSNADWWRGNGIKPSRRLLHDVADIQPIAAVVTDTNMKAIDSEMEDRLKPVRKRGKKGWWTDTEPRYRLSGDHGKIFGKLFMSGEVVDGVLSDRARMMEISKLYDTFSGTELTYEEIVEKVAFLMLKIQRITTRQPEQ